MPDASQHAVGEVCTANAYRATCVAGGSLGCRWPVRTSNGHMKPPFFLERCVCLCFVCVFVCVCVCVCVCSACSCGPWQTFSLPHSISRVNVPSAQASHQVLSSQLCLQGLTGRQWAGCDCRACTHGHGRIAGYSWPILVPLLCSAYVLGVQMVGAQQKRGRARAAARCQQQCVQWTGFPFVRVSRAGRQDLAQARNSCGGGSAVIGCRGGARRAARQCRVCVQGTGSAWAAQAAALARCVRRSW